MTASPRRPPPDSDAQREIIHNQLIDLTSNRIDDRKAFDDFCVMLVGVRFNGERKVLDDSGGLFGRLVDRVTTLEHTVVADRKSYKEAFKALWKAVAATAAIVLIGEGLSNLDKAKWIVQLFK